jgi:hypothetical protein
MIVSFTEKQMALLQQVAGNLPVSEREKFISCVGIYLQTHGAYDDVTDDIVDRAIDLALRDVVQPAA